jgi:hypothetical protein
MVLSDVEELISILDVVNGGSVNGDDLICIPNLLLLIRTYLRGVGHPDVELVRRIVDDKTFRLGSEDHLLRSVAFIRAITGTPFMPVNGSLFVSVVVCKKRTPINLIIG